MKFNFYLLLWGIFAPLDPDPDPADQTQCRSGSETLLARQIFVEHEHFRRTLEGSRHD
jgi:hypothetical protein